MGERLPHRRPAATMAAPEALSFRKLSTRVSSSSGQVPSLVTMKLTEITPEMARGLLRRAHPGRRRQEETVRAYAQAMRGGFWVLNGVPVILSRTGVLLDGMQRLAACVETGIPLRAFLAEHVADETFHTIDQHRGRTFAGLLKQRGHQQHHLLANLLLRLAEYDSQVLGGPPVTPASWVRLVRILAACPGIGSALAGSLARTASPLPEPARSMVSFMGQQVSPAQTRSLLDALEAPGPLAAGHPAAALHRELERLRGTASWEKPAALLITALNALLKDAKSRGPGPAPRAGGRKPAKAFPRLLGYQGFGGLGMALPDDTGARNIHWQMETIDAATASRYLATGAPRQAIPAHVQALAADIQRGRWVLNAQPVCFAADGQLIDGMHRLMAVVAADGTIRTPVVRGLPEDARSTYDTQPRRIAAAESLAGDFGDQGLATAMANLLWRHERRTASTHYKRAGAAEIREILTQHPRLIELRGFARRMVKYGRSSVIGYAAYVMEREDAPAAAAFLDALSTEAELAEGHPVLALRQALQRLRSEGASQTQQLSALLAGWRRFRASPAGREEKRRQAASRAN